MRRPIPLLLLTFLCVYLLPLGVLPLTSPDETRYAEIPREMLASGDWVVPTLNGLLYFEKPPLGYWLTAISILLFGENAFAVRLPSALAVAGTAIVLFAWLWRQDARRRTHSTVPALATWIYLTCPMVFAIGSTAVLDNLLTLFVTGSILAFALALDSSSKQRRAWLIVGGLCCGLAFLAKGFLALAVPGLVIGAWMTVKRRFREMLRIPWLPLLVASAVVAPWGIAVHFQRSDFWRYFFWVEHVQRFLDPVGRSQHPEPFWFFVPFLLAGMLPWLPAIPAAIRGGLQAANRRRNPDPRGDAVFLGLWVALPFLFFSLSSGKLGTYILPCFPPLAALIAIGLSSHAEGRRSGARNFDWIGLAAWVSVIIGLAGAVALAIWGRQYFADGERWKWLTMVAGAGLWALAASAILASHPQRRKSWMLGLAPIGLYLLLRVAVPAEVKAGHAFEDTLVEWSSQIPADALVVTDSSMVHAACWSLKRQDLALFQWGGELRYGLAQRGAAHRVVRDTQVSELLTGDSPRRDVVFVMEERPFRRLLEPVLAQMPVEPVAELRQDGMVLLRFQMGTSVQAP